MKIALCMSGQPRFIEKAYPSILENVILPNSPDIFVHTWFDKSPTVFRGDGAWGSNPNNKPVPNTIELITQLYKPVDAMFETPGKFINSKINVDDTIDHYAPHFKGNEQYLVEMIYSMWYSIYQSNLVKERFRLTLGKHYDIVIRCRFDSTFTKKIICSEYDNSKINIGCDRRNPGHLSDWFAFGSNTIMNVYSDVYNFIDFIHERRRAKNIPDFCNEILLWDHLESHGIGWSIIPDLHIEFIRPWS